MQITPGGSLANTLVAISRLSKASGRSRLNVALAASCSSDAVGQYFATSLNNAGVAVLPVSEEPGHTGTVFVLSSPDVLSNSWIQLQLFCRDLTNLFSCIRNIES